MLFAVNNNDYFGSGVGWGNQQTGTSTLSDEQHHHPLQFTLAVKLKVFLLPIESWCVLSDVHLSLLLSAVYWSSCTTRSVLLHKHFAGKVTEASRATHEEANLRLQ